MADTTYTDYVQPAVSAEWLNEINDHVWHDTPVQGIILHAADKIGFVQSGTGSVPRTMQDKGRESVSVEDFGAVGDGVTDDTAAWLAACESHRVVYLHHDDYKITATIPLLGRTRIISKTGRATIHAYGCDAFQIDGANGDWVSLDGITLVSYTAGGTIDPKTHTGVKAAGTASNHVNYLKLSRCYFRGWNRSIDWQYTWNSVIDDCTTINCNYGLRVFGQSVNNSIVSSRLGANGGVASIDLVSDGAIIGEGLMIANTLLAEGDYGVYSNNGFLALEVVNCTTDLIKNVGFRLVDTRSVTITGGWIYAVNRGVQFADLGVSVPLCASISGVGITVTAVDGIGIHVGYNNVGVSINGGSITSAGASSYSVYSDSSNCTVDGTFCNNGGALDSVFFNADRCRANITGNLKVRYNARTQTPSNLLYGGGVQFPVNQVASSDANTLDDYEEGTWTPILQPTTGAFASVTYSSERGGLYVKIGRLVHVQGVISMDALSLGSAAGMVDIAGLPFAAANGRSCLSIGLCSGFASNHPSVILVQEGQTIARLFYRTASNGGTTVLAPSDLGTGAGANRIFFSGTYMAEN